MYDFTCEKMHCKMSYISCIKRQELLKKKQESKGWGQVGRLITTDECEKCDRGKEIARKINQTDNLDSQM